MLDLRAAPLEGRTLAEAIAQLVQEIRSKEQLAISFHSVGAHRPLPVAVEAGLYRVAQEALTNIDTHAQAARAKVELSVTPQTVQLTIQDDGCGFETGGVTPNRYGLTGMNERVRLLGGHLQIESAPGAGTKVVVTAPLIARL
jgi:two-component system, NarL family, sensor kinase